MSLSYSNFMNLLPLSNTPTSKVKLLFSQVDRSQRHFDRNELLFKPGTTHHLFHCATILRTKF